MTELICMQGHVMNGGAILCQRCNCPAIGTTEHPPEIANAPTEKVASAKKTTAKKEVKKTEKKTAVKKVVKTKTTAKKSRFW